MGVIDSLKYFSVITLMFFGFYFLLLIENINIRMFSLLIYGILLMILGLYLLGLDAEDTQYKAVMPWQSASNDWNKQKNMMHNEMQQLRMQLSNKNISESYSASDIKKMHTKVNQLQQQIAETEKSNVILEKELEEEKSKDSPVIQHITYNIQDSAIAGDINTNQNVKK